MQLWPGIHYGHARVEPADDIPLDPVEVTVPLYPGAVLTDRVQEHANFHHRPDHYLKSAVASYEVPAGEEEVERW